MSMIDLTIEKTYMARNSRQYRKSTGQCEMEEMEQVITDFFLSIFEEKSLAPPYWGEEMSSPKQKKRCIYEMTTLAYAVCLMVSNEEAPINLDWVERLRHSVEMQLSYVDHKYAHYVMLEAFMMMKLFKNSLPHSHEYLDVLDKVFELQKDLFRKIEMSAVEKSQKRKYTFTPSVLQPTQEMIFDNHIDWVYYTHAFEKNCIKIWIDEYADTERKKTTLLSQMEKCFEDYVKQHERIREEVNNENMADF